MRSPSLVLLLSLALTGGAAAQTAPVPPVQPGLASPPGPASASPVSLAGTLGALRASPGWRSAELRYRGAELALSAARARAGLNVTVGADTNAVKVPADSGELKVSSAVNVQAAVSVLPWSPALEAVRSAERALTRAAADRRAAQATLAINAVQAYWGARSAGANLALAEAQLALATRQLTVAQAQRTAGVLPTAGLLAREQALGDAQAGQRQAREGADLAARQLANLLGQPVTLPADPAAYGPLPTEPRVQGAADALMARALIARAEVTGAGNDLADAQAQLRAARLDASLPDLNASVQYGQLGGGQTAAGWTVGGSLNAKTGVLAGQISVPVKAPDERPTGLALALSGSFSLVGGGKATAVRSAEVAVQGAELALETARQSVDLEVRQRHADLLAALDTLASRRGALRQATDAQASARARLEAGLVTALEVDEADLAVRQATLGAEQALIQAQLASLRLAQATAELDPTLLTALPSPAAPALSTPAAPEARP